MDKSEAARSYRRVSEAEANEVGIEEATLREAIRTPIAQRTDEQKALNAAWKIQQRKDAAKWYADRGFTPPRIGI